MINTLDRVEFIQREPFGADLDYLTIYIAFEGIPHLLYFEDVCPAGLSVEDISAGLVQRINLELERCPKID